MTARIPYATYSDENPYSQRMSEDGIETLNRLKAESRSAMNDPPIDPDEAELASWDDSLFSLSESLWDNEAGWRCVWGVYRAIGGYYSHLGEPEIRDKLWMGFHGLLNLALTSEASGKVAQESLKKATPLVTETLVADPGSCDAIVTAVRLAEGALQLWHDFLARAHMAISHWLIYSPGGLLEAISVYSGCEDREIPQHLDHPKAIDHAGRRAIR